VPVIYRRRAVVSFVLTTGVLLSAAVAPLRACELTCQGLTRHRTGDEGGGCFGLDPDDPVSACETTLPDVSYRLYAGSGCTGAEIASGEGRSSFDPPARAASVELTCRPGT
jgi:hypothetical protein